MLQLFTPLWPALAALFLSHGLSFVHNFLGRGEYRQVSLQGLMAAPYGRIVLMQFTLILGGWILILLKTPLWVLALLIMLKIGMDLRAHHAERARVSMRFKSGQDRATTSDFGG